MIPPEKRIPNEVDGMARTQTLADSFVQKLLHDSPLAPALRDQVDSEYKRFASMKYPLKYPYASLYLYSTHPSYPHHDISTSLQIVMKPDGTYRTKSVRQALDTKSPMQRAYPYDNFVHETFLDAFGGVSGLIFNRQAWITNPRDRNGFCTLEIQFGFGPDGKLSVREHPPNHSFKTKIILFQAYSDGRTEDPERIEMDFPLQWRGQFAFPDVMYVEFPTEKQPWARIPYDTDRLSLLRERGIMLPTNGGITATGEFFMDIGLIGDGPQGEGQRVFIPSSVGIYEQTFTKLQLAVSPQRPVSTMPSYYRHLRNESNTWHPDKPIV